MNEFYLSRKISARLSLRAAVRMFCILTLALWGPAMAGAQAQPQPPDGSGGSYAKGGSEGPATAA